ncbi:hypothetical protein O6H91_04G131100 [Diphasiastrum complanatum]|uniref:Uncharacterized protein n=3 Tax=Diphasiastrum complanatum TaxID=34168 RepID=A0ACC2E255_DIPCM|nr:hypothetical protein O6H91_04G131100 [Diphasiastrum complanatum]KAJ7560465.1 hypothetical protein O6H91_04G131100 [Diphasiastrum complanatum]
MMSRMSSVSGLSSVMLDLKLGSDASQRREKILGVSGSSAGNVLPSLEADEIEELREEDVWAEEIRGWADNEDDHRRDGYGYVKDGADGVEQPRVVSGRRRWLARDKDPFGDGGLARGLSVLSQLDRGFGISSAQGGVREGARPTASRMIPQLAQSLDTTRQRRYQSAPVDVPDWSKILGCDKKKMGNAVSQPVVEDDDEDDERLPPHELLAREYAKSQMTTFSVFEGAGRTLKGRDLSRVRNAVLRKTGFIDL